MYFLMELVSGGELLDALDSLGLLKYNQATAVAAWLVELPSVNSGEEISASTGTQQ